MHARHAVLLGFVACSPFGSAATTDSVPLDGGSPNIDGGSGQLEDIGRGNGKDGPLEVSSDIEVNVFATLSQPAVEGTKELLVSDTSGFAKDDVVLVWQPNGLEGTRRESVTLDDSVGAGRYQLLRIVDVVTGKLGVATTVRGTFAPASQVVRVPQFTNLTIPKGGRIHAKHWTGRTGGMVAFFVSGELVVDGEIAADGAGFRGGKGRKTPATFGCDGLDRTTLEHGYANKGEGLANGAIVGAPNLANGGGGGACHNAGGGGGGHGGRGGKGGRSCRDCDGDRDAPQGLGGAAVLYDVATRLVMGGGGGAGETDDSNSPDNDGGDGGGVIFIRAGSIRGAGGIHSIGAQGGGSDESGAGGGGAGGLVFVDAPGGCVTTSARGGKGGDVRVVNAGLGPGGGGGGGVVVRLGAQCTANLDGGPMGLGPGGDKARGDEVGGKGR